MSKDSIRELNWSRLVSLLRSYSNFLKRRDLSNFRFRIVTTLKFPSVTTARNSSLSKSSDESRDRETTTSLPGELLYELGNLIPRIAENFKSHSTHINRPVLCIIYCSIYVYFLIVRYLLALLRQLQNSRLRLAIAGLDILWRGEMGTSTATPR